MHQKVTSPLGPGEAHEEVLLLKDKITNIWEDDFSASGTASLKSTTPQT